jgi:hypothetical protein
MRRLETVPACGIVVVRDWLEPALLMDFVDECRALRGRGVNYFASSVPGDPREVVTSGFFLHNVADYAATTRVVSLLYPDMRPTIKLAVNFQSPWAEQAFHRDTRQFPVATVHAGDCGAIDVLTSDQDRVEVPVRQVTDCELDVVDIYDPDEYISVPVNAGDVVVQTRPALLHRGRNAGPVPRETLSVYTR